MINNRQQGNRRRGRGGQRPPGLSGNSGGNRQDNRGRGNAAQLLEKYKSLARDSQLAGDRVQTEYYLQFADHYFRVLGETRSRYDEQRRARGEDEDEDLDDEGMDDGDESGEPQRQERGDRPERRDRFERPERDRGERPERDRAERSDRERPERAERPERDRAERTDRPDRGDGGGERRERVAREDRGERRERGPRLNGRIRQSEDLEEAPAQIAFDTLPPAIGVSSEPDSPVESLEAEDAPKPRRRTRRPRVAEGDEEIAPAA